MRCSRSVRTVCQTYVIITRFALLISFRINEASVARFVRTNEGRQYIKEEKKFITNYARSYCNFRITIRSTKRLHIDGNCIERQNFSLRIQLRTMRVITQNRASRKNRLDHLISALTRRGHSVSGSNQSRKCPRALRKRDRVSCSGSGVSPPRGAGERFITRDCIVFRKLAGRNERRCARASERAS